jgi:hypothetical protein
MYFKNLIFILTVLALHFAFFKYVSNHYNDSKLNYYVNVVKSALVNKPIEVSVQEMKIQQSFVHPDRLMVTLLISEKNTGESVVTSANYSLVTQNGLTGDREVFYDKNWKPLDTGILTPGQQKEGAVFFEIPKSDHYTFTYSRGYQTAQYEIPSEEGLFIPFVINPV